MLKLEDHHQSVNFYGCYVSKTYKTTIIKIRKFCSDLEFGMSSLGLGRD